MRSIRIVPEFLFIDQLKLTLGKILNKKIPFFWLHLLNFILLILVQRIIQKILNSKLLENYYALAQKTILKSFFSFSSITCGGLPLKDGEKAYILYTYLEENSCIFLFMQIFIDHCFVLVPPELSEKYFPRKLKSKRSEDGS